MACPLPGNRGMTTCMIKVQWVSERGLKSKENKAERPHDWDKERTKKIAQRKSSQVPTIFSQIKK